MDVWCSVLGLFESWVNWSKTISFHVALDSVLLDRIFGCAHRNSFCYKLCGSMLLAAIIAHQLRRMYFRDPSSVLVSDGNHMFSALFCFAKSGLSTSVSWHFFFLVNNSFHFAMAVARAIESCFLFICSVVQAELLPWNMFGVLCGNEVLSLLTLEPT